MWECGNVRMRVRTNGISDSFLSRGFLICHVLIAADFTRLPYSGALRSLRDTKFYYYYPGYT